MQSLSGFAAPAGALVITATLSCAVAAAPRPPAQCTQSCACPPAPAPLPLPAPDAAHCFPRDGGDADFDRLAALTGLRPPGEPGPGDLRYFSVDTVWTGDGGQGPAGRAARARLTYSFPDDGTPWDGLTNSLGAALTAPGAFGPGNLDQGREIIRQGLAAWRRIAGVEYQEVADDNAPRTAEPARSLARGDIRIGGFPAGTPNFLAYNYFPASGAEMIVNTSYLLPTHFLAQDDAYRYLRNTMAHEHGHGLGLNHTVPCDQTRLMEPLINTRVDGPAVDEVRGAGRHYGDRFAGNHAPAAAHDLGELGAPPRSVIERDLSTNSAAGPAGTGEDWFAFSLQASQPVTLRIDPTGGAYLNGPQSTQCDSASAATVNAAHAGNLVLELRDAAGAAVLFSSSAGGPGMPEIVGAGWLPPGRYTVRVADTGPNDPINQFVQLYDLTIRVGPDAGAPAAPRAIAGINKRIRAGATCFFMGDANSFASEAGAVITSYDWDLDGDGVFEVAGNPRPVRVYQTPGVRTVTLRVTDSAGLASTDAITVTVWGDPAAPCIADWDQSGDVAPGDVSMFVLTWFGDVTGGLHRTNVDGDDAVTPSDIAWFMARWFAALSGPC